MDNRFFVSGNIAVIELRTKIDRFYYTFIDLDDLDRVLENVRIMYLAADETTGYADCALLKGEKKRLHRFLMNTPDGLVVDHINQDGLDNRKRNLRNCTVAENTRSRRKYAPCRFSYKEYMHEQERKIIESYKQFLKSKEEKNHA